MFFVKTNKFRVFRARIVMNGREFLYGLLLLIIVNDNELCAFIIRRTEGAHCVLPCVIRTTGSCARDKRISGINLWAKSHRSSGDCDPVPRWWYSTDIIPLKLYIVLIINIHSDPLIISRGSGERGGRKGREGNEEEIEGKAGRGSLNVWIVR